jgi:pilus assembly protein CpaB
MILRLILFTVMALGLVGFGVVAWISAYPPASTDPAKEAARRTVAVLTLAHDVHAGTLLKSDDITSKDVAPADLPTGATTDSPDARRALVGGMVRRALATGDLVLPADVMRPGDHGFLAAVLQPGMRAVTVAVDAVSGTAGLIWPGDRVDVIMTQQIDDPALPLGRRISAEAVLRDARVIAIDQELVQGASPGAVKTETARTITLEVTQEQAERIQVATRIGRLSLAVRSAELAALPAAEAQSPIWADDVSHALAAAPPAKPQPNVLRVYQGAADGKDFHF